MATVIPHFTAFPLLSSKQRDFERFSRICEAVRAGDHLERHGLERIIRMAMQMNPSGKRKYSAGGILGSLAA